MEIIGNRRTIRLLERIIDSGNIANGYLFIGPRGAGKFEAALFFAKSIAGNTEKIDANLILIEPEVEEKKGVIKTRDIRIEAIRELQHNLSLTSVGGRYKAVIINGAERLNMTAQNALLKTLEEPNEKVVLILVSQDEKKMLPTMISRCQKIRFGLVGDDKIKEIIASGGKKDMDEGVFWAMGREKIAHNFLEEPDGFERRKEAKSKLRSAFRGSIVEKLLLAEKLSKDTQDLAKKMDFWIVFLRQIMLGKMVEDGIFPDQAVGAIEEIGRSIDNIKETNANARLVLENLFLKL